MTVNRRSVAGFAVALAVVLLAWIYFISDPLAVSVARTLHLPLMTVGSETLSFDRFYREIESVVVVLNNQTLNEAEISDAIVNKLRTDYALRLLARRYNFSVDSDTLATYDEQVFSGASGDRESLMQIHRTEKNMHYSFIEPLALEDMLRRAMISDTTNPEAVYMQRLSETLPSASDEFYTYVAEHRASYGEDAYREYEVTQEQLDQLMLEPYFLDATLGYSTPVVASYDGYRIYRVLGIPESETDTWRLGELFVPYDPLTGAIKEELNKIPVRIFAPRALPH